MLKLSFRRNLRFLGLSVGATDLTAFLLPFDATMMNMLSETERRQLTRGIYTFSLC